MSSICGADCGQCPWSADCGGCSETGGRPFGAPCAIAECCRSGPGALDAWKKQLIAAFNDLHIPDMEEVTGLTPLRGSLINLEYPLPGGQQARFWDDSRIYLGAQLPKGDSGRCYGLAADERYLMVAEYGDGGDGAQVVVWKRWN